MDRLISEQSVIDAIDESLKKIFVEHRDIAKQIVSKIPSAESKEVYYSGDGYADGYMVYDMAECPNCGREFEESDEIWGCNFCPDCGQALEWEVEQDG